MLSLRPRCQTLTSMWSPEQIQQARLQLESQKTKRKNMQDYSMFAIYLPRFGTKSSKPLDTAFDQSLQHSAKSCGFTAPAVEPTSSTQPRVSPVAQAAEVRAIEDVKKADEAQPAAQVTEVQVPDAIQTRKEETARPVFLEESLGRLRQAAVKNSQETKEDAATSNLKRPAFLFRP
eukprot:s658_g8.t1